MGNLLSAFDADDTIRRNRLGGGEAKRPTARAMEALNKVRNNHLVGVATGASIESIRATEVFLGFELDFVFHSHSTVLVDRRSGEEKRTVLAPIEAQAALARRRPELEEIRESHGGILDDDHEGLYDAFYGPAGFEPARIAKSAVIRQEPHLKLLANPIDGGQSIAPVGTTKQVVVDWALAHGYEIAFAAGDSLADAPLLEAAMYPIVTFGEGLAPRSELVEIVRRKGIGFIAEKPHGDGLADGLEAGFEALSDILKSVPNPRSVL